MKNKINGKLLTTASIQRRDRSFNKKRSCESSLQLKGTTKKNSKGKRLCSIKLVTFNRFFQNKQKQYFEIKSKVTPTGTNMRISLIVFS